MSASLFVVKCKKRRFNLPLVHLVLDCVSSRRKPLHTPHIVSMLKCENRLHCAGKRPPPPFLSPPFSPVRFSSCLWGNHITTPCFSTLTRGGMERWSRCSSSISISISIPCNSAATSHLSSSSSALLLLSSSSSSSSSSPSRFVHASIQACRQRACPDSAAVSNRGSGDH